jgi:hypothetical protein
VKTRVAILLVAPALLLGACSDDAGSESAPAEMSAPAGASTSTFPEGAIAVRASSDLATGPERLLVGVALEDGTRLGSPDDRVTMSVAPVADPSAVQEQEAAWTWMVPGSVGLYRGLFDFEMDGLWEVTMIPESGEPLEPVPFSVVSDACRSEDASEQGRAACAPRVNEAAPSLATPTLSDQPIEELTTDPEPDLRFYELSLDEALANGRPTVIVFSTPAYCVSAACGPLLENMKRVIDRYPDADFVHIEVFTNLTDPDFVPDLSHLAPAAAAYTLPTEPWVFVTDESGVIVARFEGAMDPEELAAYLG